VGSDARVYVFDHARYVGEVVPALVDLVRTATIEAPWLAWFAAWRPDGMALLRRHRVDLEEHCTFLGPDLRCRDEADAGSSCRSARCPVRDRCPLHETSAGSALEVLRSAFTVAVELRCLGAGQFLGRSRTPACFSEVIEQLGVPVDNGLWDLLDALDRRAATLKEYIGVSEGIHGWLAPDETVDLALHLDELPLPRYEQSFERMGELERLLVTAPGELTPSYSREQWRLSFLRTTAFLAAERGRGVLWGNELSTEVARNYATSYERIRTRRA
jgi:hypothetical protein